MLTLHPIIRLACFFLLLLGLARLTQTLLLTTIPVLLWLFYKTHCTFSAVRPLLKRLRWLFVTLFILNLWFNSPDWTWLPTESGIWLAMERITALLSIVLAAHLLITVTSTPDIIAALQWWFNPLKKLGFPSEKLTLRLALVFDTVDQVQRLYMSNPGVQSEALSGEDDRDKASLWTPEAMSNKVVSLFSQVIDYAETTPLRTLDIPELQSPPWWQWSYPLLILTLIFLEK
jgi:energy-coupling factor transporter transmembrane protein EcfT